MLQLPNDGCTTAIIENLLLKSPAGQLAILILLTSSHTNPFVVDDLYLNPAIETLKQACGGSIKSVDHLQKYVGGKYRSEVESDFADILQGLQMKGQGKSVRLQRKNATDFHEIKYTEVLT